MSKREENLVKVKDPKGEVFEVTQRNATDLVQHNGWKFDRPEAPEINKLAHAPRAKNKAKSKLEQAREDAQKDRGTAFAEQLNEEVAKEGKKAKKAPKKAAVPEVPPHDFDSDEDGIPYDEMEAAQRLQEDVAELDEGNE